MKSKFMGDRKGIFGLGFNECCIYLLPLYIHVFVCLLLGLSVILSVSLSGRTEDGSLHLSLFLSL